MPEDLWNYGENYDVYLIDTGRLRGVVELAAEKAGWGKTLPKGEALGIAAHRSFVTYVASCVHVKVEADGTVRVPEVHTAIDCGFAANPERIRSQIEGAAVMGMTLALNSAITFENGAVQQSNYSDYDVVRCNNFPELVVTHIVPHPFSVQRRRRARRAAVRAGALQRDLQRHRQAAALATDRRSAEGLTKSRL